jgi:hypothetical protein
MLRTARTIACQAAPVSRTLRPVIAAASSPSISGLHALAA